MLPYIKTHDEYCAHLSSHLSKPNITILLRHANVTNLLRRVDLYALSKMVKPLYSRLGRLTKNPCDMLRSLLAMVLCEFTSIDIRVSAMRSFSYYATISGFDMGDVPVVGTFFEFVSRIGKQRRRPRTLEPDHVERMISVLTTG